MMNHSHLRILVSTAAFLIFVSGHALAKSMNVPNAGTLGGTRVEAGVYNITWVHHSPEVTVTVAKGKTVVATVKGRMESRNMKYQRNMIVYTAQPDGTQNIDEIRIGGTNSAIVFTK